MRRFLAIVRDTLLALRRRRLFWLHLWINVFVILLYAGLSCGPQGWSVGFGLKELEDPWLRSGTPWENTLHCWMLSRLMRFWVAGGGLFLALFATAAVLPETLEPGHAALIVPQARRRSLILCGRWVGSVIYALGHTVFCIAGLYFALRMRLGFWHHSLWLAVPLCLVLFAPLQAVAALLGVITRSAAAALLVAILFAGTVWTINATVAPAPEAAEETRGVEDEDAGSGLAEVLASESLEYAAVVLPPARESLTWLERVACPRPARSYSELFRRLRATHRGIGGAAANVLAEAATPPAQRREAALPSLHALVWPSAGFSAVVLLLAARLLVRRDL